MSHFVDALAQARSEIRNQRWVIVGLAVVALYAMHNWRAATTHFTAHFPPDLRNGSSIELSEKPVVPDTTVYTFAFYIWQQVNRWQVDGAKNYGEQIHALRNYLTPGCSAQLLADKDLRHKTGELVRRTRALMEIPGLGYRPERVQVLGGNAWKALVDLQLQETQSGVTVKDTYIRYPLRVVRYDVDREKNPWQLAIDCFGTDRPARLDAKAVEVARAAHAAVPATKDGTAAQPSATGAMEAAQGAAARPSTVASGGIEPPVLPRPSADSVSEGIQR
jgi:integrating conjugative element protein (TIGR03746 family)